MKKRHIPHLKGKGRKACFLTPVSTGACEAGAPTPTGVVTIGRKPCPESRQEQRKQIPIFHSPGSILSLPSANPSWHPESRPGAAAHGAWTSGAQAGVGGGKQNQRQSCFLSLEGGGRAGI